MVFVSRGLNRDIQRPKKTGALAPNEFVATGNQVLQRLKPNLCGIYVAAEQFAEKALMFVIPFTVNVHGEPNEVRNPSWI